MGPKMPLEIEIKFPGQNLDHIRKRLRELGAECGTPYLERNVVFDTPERSLLKERCLLRVRECEGANGQHGLITFKRPAPDDGSSGYKKQIEVESGLTNPQAMRTILASLGYAPAFAYDKIREVHRLAGVELCLDLLPFGNPGEALFPVVEIEGAEASLAAVAETLGLPIETASAANYHELNKEWRAARGLPQRDDFAFAEEELQKIRKELGIT
jgi:adenylate cyclase class 2